MSKIVITVELHDKTSRNDATELAEAIVSGLREFKEQGWQSGDLRAFVKDYDYEITNDE